MSEVEITGENPAPEESEKPHNLREKQEFFCREYLIDLNATQAALRAGYSEKTAYAQGCALLKHPEVQNRIEALKKERAAALKITAERVLQELARIAFADIRRVSRFGPDGVELVPDEELEEDDAAAISEVSQVATDKGRNIKMKMHSKERALELLSRHVGIFKDDGAPRGVTVVNVTPQLGERPLGPAYVGVKPGRIDE